MLRIVLILTTLLYPFIIYFGADSVSPGLLAGLLAALFVLRALTAPGQSVDAEHATKGLSRARSISTSARITWLIALVVVAIATWVWFYEAVFALRLYPLIVNALMLLLFAHSLINPPPLIERIAKARNMPVEDFNRGYLRGLTQIWVGFFVINIIICVWTIWFASMQTWLLYNGFIVYLLMGALFAGEFIFRQFWHAKYAAKQLH